MRFDGRRTERLDVVREPLAANWADARPLASLFGRLRRVLLEFGGGERLETVEHGIRESWKANDGGRRT